MATYVTLYKFTEQGIKNIKEAPKRYEEGIKQWEAIGGKMIAFYATQGDYDYVGIVEHPDEPTAMAFILGLGSQGNVRTTTLKAYSPEEFAKMVEKIP